MYGDLVLISVWYRTTPNPHEKICLLTLVTLRNEYDQVRGTYSQKICVWAVDN